MMKIVSFSRLLSSSHRYIQRLPKYSCQCGYTSQRLVSRFLPVYNENIVETTYNKKRKPTNFARSQQYSTSSLMSLVEYDHIVGDTLEEMADLFDKLADDGLLPEDFDCNLADGVMTIYLAEHGTYVINKQTPNRQIWLSSPTSGPKRYDFVNNTWFYSHDPDTSLHELLSKEISEITNTDVDFTQLAYGAK